MHIKNCLNPGDVHSAQNRGFKTVPFSLIHGHCALWSPHNWKGILKSYFTTIKDLLYCKLAELDFGWLQKWAICLTENLTMCFTFYTLFTILLRSKVSITVVYVIQYTEYVIKYSVNDKPVQDMIKVSILPVVFTFEFC